MPAAFGSFRALIGTRATYCNAPRKAETRVDVRRLVADGVMICCHQDPEQNPEKYQIIKRLYTLWAVE